MFVRYAIFYTPPVDSALADFGARWLGWNSATGRTVTHPFVDGLDVASVTQTPRKYGFHATLKAPFRLAEGVTEGDLIAALETFATDTPPVVLDGLVQGYFRGFVALRPVGDTTALNGLAAQIVRNFDSLRAPLRDADIARRRQAGLNARQDAQMLAWGYPYIFEDFHFHMTLSGSVSPDIADRVMHAISAPVARALPQPMLLDAVTLMGEDSSGLFHQIHRCTLSG